MLSIYVSLVPVSCKFFIDCFLTGFPETLQTFGMWVPLFCQLTKTSAPSFLQLKSKVPSSKNG